MEYKQREESKIETMKAHFGYFEPLNRGYSGGMNEERILLDGHTGDTIL